MHALLSESDVRVVAAVADRVHFETKFPEYEFKFPQVKDILSKITDADIGKTFVLIEAVQAMAGSWLLQPVPVLGKRSPWEVTLVSFTTTGDSPSGLVFSENSTGNALIIGPNDLSQGYGIIRKDELLTDNRNFTDTFTIFHETKRRAMIEPFFKDGIVEQYRVINAIENHLALLAGRVVVDLLGEIYGRKTLEKTVTEMGMKFILPAMSDTDYRNTKAKELKSINTKLEVGSFVLVEGINGMHIYEVVDGDKAMVTFNKRKPSNRVAVMEYGLTPNYNSYGQTVCEPIHASNVQFIENNILQGIVFFDMQALLEYLPGSNTNLRHVRFQQALSSFCSQLLQIKR